MHQLLYSDASLAFPPFPFFLWRKKKEKAEKCNFLYIVALFFFSAFFLIVVVADAAQIVMSLITTTTTTTLTQTHTQTQGLSFVWLKVEKIWSLEYTSFSIELFVFSSQSPANFNKSTKFQCQALSKFGVRRVEIRLLQTCTHTQRAG